MGTSPTRASPRQAISVADTRQLDQVRRPLRDGDHNGTRMPRDLVREDGHVDDAERLYPMDTELRVDRARLWIGAHPNRGRLGLRERWTRMGLSGVKTHRV